MTLSVFEVIIYVILRKTFSYLLQGDNMNEQKNNRQASKEKDYYFPVILSQLFCFVAVVAVFFFVRSTEGWQQVSEKYASLLQDDFLTVELSGAVSGIMEYLSDSSSLAVNGSRVEPYRETESEADENSADETEDESRITEKITSEEEITISEEETETTAAVALQTISVNTVQQAAPLKLEYKKKNKIVFPVENGTYTSYFGDRTDPIVGGEDFHTGVDIAADEGSPIKAVAGGRVTLTGEDDRSGKYIFIEHKSGTETFYCHCSDILAKEGESIKQGETIALVGSTGYSTGPHLHFELRVNGERTDPLPLLENAD